MPSSSHETRAGSVSGWVSIRPEGATHLDLAELWHYRELIGFLALRDLTVRYKQSLLGIAWAVVQPLATMVVFTALFSLMLGRDQMPTPEGVPYAVSTYCALVPWQLFASALAASSNSLVQNQNLITKVYFPRLAMPIAPILAAAADFVLAFAVLVAMLAFAGIAPGWNALALPLFAALAVAAALAGALWLSALNAVYRDVRHAIPFLVQLWMFATPVVYTTASIMGGQPDWLRWLYGTNPMAIVVEGFRWSIFGGPPPGSWLPGTLLVGVALAGGVVFFRRMERHFADLV